MTQLAYQTVSLQKHLLTKSGGLCTTCCTYWPKTILHVRDMCPMDRITGIYALNLQEAGYWNIGVAVGYSYWRVYSLFLPGAYTGVWTGYPPGEPEDMYTHLSERTWQNIGLYRVRDGTWPPVPMHNYIVGAFYNGTVRADGMLLGLPQYLCSFIAQYYEGTTIPVCFPADIKICVSANGTEWPTL